MPEVEIFPCSDDTDIGILAWAPLGRGVLTGKYRNGIPSDSRAAAPRFVKHVEPYLDVTLFEDCGSGSQLQLKDLVLLPRSCSLGSAIHLVSLLQLLEHALELNCVEFCEAKRFHYP
jgi:hypothetical protein